MQEMEEREQIPVINRRRQQGPNQLRQYYPQLDIPDIPVLASPVQPPLQRVQAAFGRVEPQIDLNVAFRDLEFEEQTGVVQSPQLRGSMPVQRQQIEEVKEGDISRFEEEEESSLLTPRNVREQRLAEQIQPRQEEEEKKESGLSQALREDIETRLRNFKTLSDFPQVILTAADIEDLLQRTKDQKLFKQLETKYKNVIAPFLQKYETMSFAEIKRYTTQQDFQQASNIARDVFEKFIKKYDQFAYFHPVKRFTNAGNSDIQGIYFENVQKILKEGPFFQLLRFRFITRPFVTNQIESIEPLLQKYKIDSNTSAQTLDYLNSAISESIQSNSLPNLLEKVKQITPEGSIDPDFIGYLADVVKIMSQQPRYKNTELYQKLINYLTVAELKTLDEDYQEQSIINQWPRFSDFDYAESLFATARLERDTFIPQTLYESRPISQQERQMQAAERIRILARR